MNIDLKVSDSGLVKEGVRTNLSGADSQALVWTNERPHKILQNGPKRIGSN